MSFESESVGATDGKFEKDLSLVVWSYKEVSLADLHFSGRG